MKSEALQVILEKKRFATLISSGMECSWKLTAGSELLRQLVIQCNSFQVSTARLLTTLLYLLIQHESGKQAGRLHVTTCLLGMETLQRGYSKCMCLLDNCTIFSRSVAALLTALESTIVLASGLPLAVASYHFISQHLESCFVIAPNRQSGI